MRLVFVNHAHPELPHVSGMRLGCFATAMARRGHQVILLTSTLPHTAGDGAFNARELLHHDWSAPMIVAVQPRPRRVLKLIRENGIPALPRKALTLWQFLAHGGVFADWQLPATSAARALAREFRPDLVWATFGNTSTLVLAQALAHRARCPWIVDIKDPWMPTVPFGLRRLLAARFHDASGWTANAERHREIAAPWFGHIPSTVIYSGVADAFFPDDQHSSLADGTRDVLLVGSTYSASDLQSYLGAVSAWIHELAPADRANVRFVYAGSDASRVSDALRATPLACQTHVAGQCPVPVVARMAQAATAVCYLKASDQKGGFHQKLLELLASGRPVICYPHESPESLRLAAQIATPFASCGSPLEIQDALARAWVMRKDATATAAVPPWRWSDFAVQLEAFFDSVLRDGAPQCAA